MNSWNEKRKKKLTEEQRQELLRSKDFREHKRALAEQQERIHARQLAGYLHDKGEIE